MTQRNLNIGKISTFPDEDGVSELSSMGEPNTLSIFRRKYSLEDEDESVLLHNAVSYVLNGAMGQRNHPSLEIDDASHEMEVIRPSPSLSSGSNSMEGQEQLSPSSCSDTENERDKKNEPVSSNRRTVLTCGKYLWILVFLFVLIGIVGGIAGWAISYALSNKGTVEPSEEKMKMLVFTSSPSDLMLSSPSISPSQA
jgi:hypothetical protein